MKRRGWWDDHDKRHAERDQRRQERERERERRRDEWIARMHERGRPGFWLGRARGIRTLQQRLFKWFGAAILTSGIVVFVVMQWLGGSPTGKRDLEMIRSFAQNRYAEAWHDKAQLKRLSDKLASELDLSVRVFDRSGLEMYRNGGQCKHKFDLDINDGAEKLGHVEVCRRDLPWLGMSRFAIAPITAVFVLWLASVAIARRLGRPLEELTRVAIDIGRGKLDRRYASRVRDTEEVRLLGDALNEMATRIGKQLEDQRALLAAVSHELRSPLARMRVLVEILADHSEGKRPELAQLDDEVKQVDQLVGDLLASARTDFSALAVRRIDLTQLVLESFDQLQLDPTKLEVAADLGAVDGAFLDGDATLLTRAVQNLLSNAVRHAGGVHCLRISGNATELRVEVDDDGPGIPAGEELQIFEPFFRARSQKGAADTSSVGLGLSLVKRIAEAHGGRVFAERREPQGSRIGFTLLRKKS